MSTRRTAASPAFVLVKHVWDHVQEGTPHSWTRLNAAMTDAVTLAITAGLHFDPDDWKTISKTMRGVYWFHPDHLYTVAIEYRNVTACVSYETLVGRPPYLFGGARLGLNSVLVWNGEKVQVTSFAVDSKSFVACAYPGMDGYGKPTRRMTITLDELRAAEKGRVKANKERRAVAEMQTELARLSVRVPAEVVGGWTKEQRVEAMAWAATHDYDHKNVPVFMREFSRKTA